jgi:malonyl-CoA O-methyltransferase
MTSDRKARIASAFSRAHNYDEHAHIQKDAAKQLMEFLPDQQQPDILEIGCGTGFLTDYLIERYPDGSFLVSDLSSEMVKRCQEKFLDTSNIHFQCMDGEFPDASRSYDLIVSSMAVQWFSDPLEGLGRLTALLKPEGQLYYTTLGNASFAEWKEALAAVSAPSGIMQIPLWPGVFYESKIRHKYQRAEHFLRSLKKIGAGQSRENYEKLSSVLLRKACAHFNRSSSGQVTWHIVYGRLKRDEK